MNISQLLQAPISELQTMLNQLQQKALRQAASTEALIELIKFDELDDEGTIPLNELKILQIEIEIVNTVINHKQGKKTSTFRLDELTKTVQKLAQENTILRAKIAKHKTLEHEMRDYMHSQQAKQRQLHEQHQNIINLQLSTVVDMRSNYSKIKSYNSHMQHLLSWICHRKLNDPSSKAKQRNQQITQLEDLANMLSTDSAHGIIGPKFHNLLIHVSTKVGIGYADETPNSTADLELCDNERKTLINVIKTLTLYGGLTNIERQIAAEYNFAPSRLLTLISAVKRQLSLDVYNLSEGLIDHKVIAEKSTDTYEHFIASIKLLKPRPEYKLKASNAPY